MARKTKQTRTLPPDFGPNPGPQTELIRCPAKDVFFGGARGGGKTYGLIFDFLAQAQKYGQAARGVLFRKTYTELEDVIRISWEILDPLGWKFSKKPPTWESPDGATLSLRYLEVDEDAYRYQGFSFTWQGFDEAGNWPTSTAIDRLLATLRSAEGVPCVRRLTGNPGGPGHAWLKSRYVDPAEPLTPFLWSPNEAKPEYQIESVFIPSRLEDNQRLVQNDPDYEGRLAAVGSDALYRAWRFGDWDIVAGQYFDCWRPEMAVGPFYPQPWHKVWISGDWGFEDRTVIHWHALDDQGDIVTFRELDTNHKTPEELAELILKKNEDLEPKFFFFSPDAFARRSSPHTVGDEIGAVLRQSGLPAPTRADNDRVGGWQLMYQLIKNGKWRITRDCPSLIEAIPLLQRVPPKDGISMEDVEESPVDHAPDSARYGLKSFIGKTRKPIAVAVNDKIQEAIAVSGATPNLNDLILIHKREEAKMKRRLPVQRRRYGSLGR